MSKHRGEPYDPAIRKTEHGKKLYVTWVRVVSYPHHKDWENFSSFYDWAMNNGYELGAWLRRFNNEEPFSPDNCIWYIPKSEKEYIPPEWADEWNKAVNRIRKHFGLPPLEGTDYGDL